METPETVKPETVLHSIHDPGTRNSAKAWMTSREAVIRRFEALERWCQRLESVIEELKSEVEELKASQAQDQGGSE
ncbi:MAG: hypothetical protein B7733_13035 [Myxococcales bacterium FL481]|nr:MAG: hypothetical protein B7733_13035 [Myxococcales bacterium FL481]